MTLHVPACPTCGMQVYRVDVEEQDIHIEDRRLPVSILRTPRRAEPVRSRTTARMGHQ